jgi:hypothetical protein
MIIPDITLAYIDPGTGAFLLQTLMAGVLGVIFYFRSKVKSLWTWLFHRKEKQDDEKKVDQP